jgi:hypothetical protein
MRSFSIFLNTFSLINIVLCCVFSLYGNVFPQKIIAGSTINNIGWLLCLISLFATGILTAIYYISFRLNRDVIFNFSSIQTVVFWITVLYLAYRMFFFTNILENSLTTTSTTLMVFMALAINNNFLILVATSNVLKNK